MQKNDEITLSITGIDENGSGIGRYNGIVIFVKGAVPGDTILCGIISVKKNFCVARVISILDPSPERVEPDCPAFGSCGGCSLMHMSYEAELALKEQHVRDVLTRIAGIEESSVRDILAPIIGCKNTKHYRNKAQYPVAPGPLIGFYAKRSHRVIEQKNCQIGHPEDGNIISCIKKYIIQNNIHPYDENSKKGVLRHILIRHGDSTGETMVCLVMTTTNINLKNLWKNLRDNHGVTSLCVNLNKLSGNVILGKKTKTAFGNGYITDTYKVGRDISVRISPESFYQVNHAQMEILYSLVLEYANLSGKEVLWDVYCGIGTIGMALAPSAKKIIGIEEIPMAIEDAKENARINHITNMDFLCGPAEQILSEAGESLLAPDVIVVDPPRSGCDERVLSAMAATNANSIIYVSCNPSTLARDIKFLYAQGYTPIKITPVDQFCRTSHVEVVVKMSQINQEI